MSKLRMIICCALLVFMALPAFADEIVSAKLGYQSLAVSGTLAGNQNGIGTQVDVENDLNLADSEDMTAEIALQLGRSRLSLGYLPLEFAGTGQMTVTGAYNGQTFNLNDVVQTKVKLTIYDVGYTFNLLNLDDLPIRVQFGPELAVKVVDAEVDFVDAAAGINEHDSATIPVPTLGGRARIGLSDFIGIVARIGYMEYDGNSFMDAEAQVEFSPLPFVGVYAGYRAFSLKVDESDLAVDVDFSGPFAGALVRF